AGFPVTGPPSIADVCRARATPTLFDGNARHPRLSYPYRDTVMTAGVPGGRERGPGRCGGGPLGGQPFSATAIASASGVVGRPVRRDRSPLSTTSSPRAMEASTPA